MSVVAVHAGFVARTADWHTAAGRLRLQASSLQQQWLRV
jgi:hypothetical protein